MSLDDLLVDADVADAASAAIVAAHATVNEPAASEQARSEAAQLLELGEDALRQRLTAARTHRTAGASIAKARRTIALLAPGQGSQTPGMLAPWLDSPGVRDDLTKWSRLVGLDLAELGTTATAETVKATEIAQPLIVVTGLLGYRELERRGVLQWNDLVLAGHGVGELTAYAIAGLITDEAAVKLAAIRGAEMARASELEPTGLAAVLGGNFGDVLNRVEELGLLVANVNALNQLVVGGRIPALEKLAEDQPTGTRVRMLSVAGAYQTWFMGSAVSEFEAAVAHTPTAESPLPGVTLLTNFDGNPVVSPTDAMNKLVSQIVQPIRWDQVTNTIRGMRVDAVVELPPAGTLVGIARRELKGLPTVTIKVPDDVRAVSAIFHI